MSRSIRAVLIAIVMIAAAGPAFAEFTDAAEVPFATVFYCDCNKESVIVEGTVLSAWDWSNDGATLWRVSFAGLKGVGALTGKSGNENGLIRVHRADMASRNSKIACC